MIELVKERQENSKAFRLDDGRKQLVISIGAVHYKDNYANKSERWKDIDLTWVDNKITKAPYELTREGNKLTIRDKKSGEVSTIELLGDVGRDTDIEVMPEFNRVKFTRILKSDKAPREAKFRVTGNFIVCARDEGGELPVKTTLKDGILTETLKPDRPVKYPVRIDPTTYQPGQDSDDTIRGLGGEDIWQLNALYIWAGADITFWRIGCGMRFPEVAIAQAGTVDNAKLTLRAATNRAGTVCNTRISAEAVDDAITFADDKAAFDTRYGNNTATVDWNAEAAWTAGEDYDSPEIKTVIQAIVDRGGWNSGQDIVIFWEDFDDRSDHNGSAYRSPYSYRGSAEFAPKLVITLPIGAPTVTAQAASSIEDTTATGNGNITDNGGEDCDIRGIVWDLASHGDPGDVAPGASGYANDVAETDSFGTGAFTRSLTSLPTGNTIYYRAYAHNSGGYDYSNTEISFLTKPAAATNVAATTNLTDKVTVTWTKSTGATSYKVYEGANLLDTLGDVATYDDTNATAGTIDNAGTATAEDGGTVDVTLSLAGESVASGASRTYKVVAFNATGDADDSGTDAGYRTPGTITYQWQISAADSDADYGNISGATTDPYNHLVTHTDGRYYKCVCSSVGASNSPTTSSVDRGWRKHLLVTDGDLIGIPIIRKS